MHKIDDLKKIKNVFVMYQEGDDVTLEHQPAIILQGGLQYLKRLEMALEDHFDAKIIHIAVEVDERLPGLFAIKVAVGDHVGRLFLKQAQNY
jgi:hypothetical protein